MGWVETTSAVSTAAAVAVALSFGIRAEWRAARAERRAEELQLERTAELERRQASRVASWLVPDPDPAEDDEPGWQAILFVKNASDEPIWEAMVMYRDTLEHPTEGTLYIMDEWEIIAPAEQVRQKVRMRLNQERRMAQLIFRDNAGKQWWRNEQGVLDTWPPEIAEPMRRSSYVKDEHGVWREMS